MLRIKSTIYLTGQVNNNVHPDDGTNSKQIEALDRLLFHHLYL